VKVGESKHQVHNPTHNLLAILLEMTTLQLRKYYSLNDIEREARVGIEPTHTAFAEPRLTTWLPRLFDCEGLSYSIARKDAKKKFRERFAGIGLAFDRRRVRSAVVDISPALLIF
jgi:hypothetical protein